MRSLSLALVLACVAATVGFAQDITVSRDNRTVEVTVTASVQAEPEVAVLSLRHSTFGRTHDAAFAENVQAADRILDTLHASGVPGTSIETQEVKFERTEPNDKWTPEQRTERQFTASQSWEVRVPVANAQSVLDAAVKAGANDLRDVDWQVKDPDALDAKASAAALEKARVLAEKMVAGFGAKLGELIYASNTARRPKDLFLETENAVVVPPPPPPGSPQLNLFPKKVGQDATVHAIFAID